MLKLHMCVTLSPLFPDFAVLTVMSRGWRGEKIACCAISLEVAEG
jgi:hypothetical protein